MKMKNFATVCNIISARPIMVLALLAIMLVPSTAQQLDPANWTGARNVDDVYTIVEGNALAEGKALKLLGFNMGGNPQYALSPALSADYRGKLATIKFKFDGEFVSPEASFIAFVTDATSARTIFWGQACYAFLIKENKIEVQKHGRGTNPNFAVRFEDVPALGFKRFPIGKEMTITFGVLRNESFPRWVFKINGVEVFSGVDNKYGQTVRPNPNSMIMVGLFATNREDLNDPSSRSSVTIYSIE